ncbi:hypothetical protein I7I53_03130 [Histoplasma capsulatum var. duboisii H88]|uniref:Uncharacterized protein n=1 Tax=Ajellomyces capsulatus (strain H88) TaxID=544711 RepID=A0A8A1LLT5_AJEC8|nr:hypothetical protein I7I53_03130 [Histoplasma capsulatum var. duboisii H88]
MSVHYLRSLPTKADIRFLPQNPQPWEWYSQFWPEFVGFINYTSYWAPFHPYFLYLQDQRTNSIHSLIRPWGNANFVGSRYFRRNAKFPVGVGFEVGTCSCHSLLSGGALLHHIVSIFSIGQPNYSTRLEKECRRAILMFTLDSYCSVGEVYKF